MAASKKTSLVWAQKRDDRACWARTAVLEADMGSASPFTYFDETIGALRSVKCALLLPGDSSLEKLMNDETYRDGVDALYRAGAVVAFDAFHRYGPTPDLLLISKGIDLRVKIQCAGLPELQKRGLVVQLEPFVAEALASSTAVLGEDEASVKLRKKHAIYRRKPCSAAYKNPDVVDGIPCMRLGSSRSFEVRPDVLSASDQRVAARGAAKGRGRRGR